MCVVCNKGGFLCVNEKLSERANLKRGLLFVECINNPLFLCISLVVVMALVLEIPFKAIGSSPPLENLIT